MCSKMKYLMPVMARWENWMLMSELQFLAMDLMAGSDCAVLAYTSSLSGVDHVIRVCTLDSSSLPCDFKNFVPIYDTWTFPTYPLWTEGALRCWVICLAGVRLLNKLLLHFEIFLEDIFVSSGPPLPECENPLPEGKKIDGIACDRSSFSFFKPNLNMVFHQFFIKGWKRLRFWWMRDITKRALRVLQYKVSLFVCGAGGNTAQQPQ